MKISKWDDLLAKFLEEDAVEEWLWKADIVAEISSEKTDLETIARSLFGCIENFSTSKEILYRSYQLLHQICKNSDDVLDTEKETSMNATIVQKSLRRWISHTDIVSICFQYLATASERKSDDISGILPFDLLQTIFASLKAHRLSTIVQQPGTQIVLNLLSNTTTTAPMLDDRVLHKSIGHIICNLQFQREDFLVIKACCSSLESVVRTTPLATIAMYTDDILALTTETFHRYYTVVEVASACLLTIEKLAVQERHFIAICPSSVQLFRLCESMQSIKNNETYQLSFLAACSIMHRLVKSECILSVLLDSDSLTGRIFIKSLKGFLAHLFANVDVYYTNTLSPQQQQHLIGLTSEIASEVESWLQVSPNDSMTKKSKDRFDVHGEEILTEVGRGDDENKSSSIVVSVKSKCANGELNSTASLNASATVILNDNNKNKNNDGNNDDDDDDDDNNVERCRVVPGGDTDKLPLDTAPTPTPSHNFAPTSTVTPTSNITLTPTFTPTTITPTPALTPPPLLEHLATPSISDTSMIIEVIQESQSQAALAIRRSDILHTLFIEAAQKMEVTLTLTLTLTLILILALILPNLSDILIHMLCS